MTVEGERDALGDAFVAKEVCNPGGRGGEISQLLFSADGEHLVTGTRDFSVRIHCTKTGNVELLAPPLAGSNDYGGYHAGHLSCDVVVHPSRGLLMPAGSATGGIIIWDGGKGGRRTADLRNNGHEYGCSVSHLAAYPGGRDFVSGDLMTLKVWSADDLRCVRTLRSAFRIEIVVVSSEDRYILCAGRDVGNQGVIAVWDGGRHSAGTGARDDLRDEPIRLLQGHGRPICSLHVPNDPDLIVTTSLDGRVALWSIASGACTKTIWSKAYLHSELSYAGLVNRGAWMLTHCRNGTLQVWDLDDACKCVVTVEQRPSASAPLAISRCGRLVAFVAGTRLQLVNFDALADRSKLRRPGKPGAYLQSALVSITTPVIRQQVIQHYPRDKRKTLQSGN